MFFHLNKKSYSIIIFLLVLSSQINAQQLPLMNHYIYKPYLLNPAMAGNSQHSEININLKKQWVNMPNSPLSGVLFGQVPLNNSRLGLGAMVYSDKVHLINKTGALTSIAYHLPLSKVDKLSGGIALGFLHRRLNIGQGNLLNPDDPLLIPNNNTGTKFDFSLGFNYSRKEHWNIGLMLLQGLGNKISTTSQGFNTYKDYTLARQFVATINYKDYQLGNFAFTPSLLIRYIKDLPMQIEANILGNWKDFLYLGIGYRSSNINTNTTALMTSFGIKIKANILLAYSSDLGLSKQQNISLGSQHELLLSYNFGQIKNKKSAPKHLLYPIEANKLSQATIDLIEKEIQEENTAYKLLGSINFNNEESKLNNSIKNKLQAFLPTLLANRDKAIYLYTIIPQRKNNSHNLKLQEERSKAIQSYLQEHNIPFIYVMPSSIIKNNDNMDNINKDWYSVYLYIDLK